MLDGGAHFYDSYETADGKYIAIGSVEPQFYRTLLELLGLAGDAEFTHQLDPRRWPHLKGRLTRLFKSKSRAEWCTLLEGSDACFTPILSMAEVPGHAHNAVRNAFIELAGVIQPAPAPRYSGTPTAAPSSLDRSMVVAEQLLTSVGYSNNEIRQLREAGSID